MHQRFRRHCYPRRFRNRSRWFGHRGFGGGNRRVHRDNTSAERRFLEEFETTYKTYFSNARLFENTRPSNGETASLEEFAPLEIQSENLLELAYLLANAHRKTLNQYLAKSDSALATLRNVLPASLFLLFWFGAGLAVVICRQMIAPLRLKVLESRELLEQQENPPPWACWRRVSPMRFEIRSPP